MNINDNTTSQNPTVPIVPNGIGSSIHMNGNHNVTQQEQSQLEQLPMFRQTPNIPRAPQGLFQNMFKALPKK